ncbi:MAG: DNA translocase FtsK 4TM domain-containing protein [Deferribacterales bacterium]|nr:DNA translocase FtsK 4TM domain-containing protein [Deferribacterales bacterium]
MAFDIVQLFFLLIAVFFLLSLLSYSPNDPSGFTTVKTDEPVVFENLLAM